MTSALIHDVRIHFSEKSHESCLPQVAEYLCAVWLHVTKSVRFTLEYFETNW